MRRFISAPPVAIVGSLNIDYIARVQKLPGAGQTVAASGLVTRFGGKGANQAVAAARQGASVRMVGCVGSDDAGKAYIKRLRDEGIQTQGLFRSPKAPTGTALIAVDDCAENLIVVAAGANGHLKPAHVRLHRRLIETARTLLLQFEVPLSAILESIRIAEKAGVPVILNPSPLKNDFPWGKVEISTLLVNEGEAEAIFGLKASSMKASADQWRRSLCSLKISQLVVTRGALPTLLLTHFDYVETPALRVSPVDTVGAGDAFAGTLTARLALGSPIPDAIRYANCAGALTTLKAGAQESIPGRDATDRAENRLPK
jgi:ribokinase